ncbi:hypothetical protein OPT61_g9383 [Boeremia exigua]|uniref:Uncharacterized protein n=1 Tax=Boeremia exigua TaxID=749465 RepID=A0ACC2HUS3_9PLEO|nr:hypothetical protein OPT61_g9383 [Boeremia exigua]
MTPAACAVDRCAPTTDDIRHWRCSTRRRRGSQQSKRLGMTWIPAATENLAGGALQASDCNGVHSDLRLSFARQTSVFEKAARNFSKRIAPQHNDGRAACGEPLAATDLTSTLRSRRGTCRLYGQLMHARVQHG